MNITYEEAKLRKKKEAKRKIVALDPKNPINRKERRIQASMERRNVNRI